MRKGCDLQTHTGKPIALDLSAALGTPVTSASKSSKPVKPPTRSARLLRLAFALRSAVSCTFTAESCSLSPCCPKHWPQLVSSICCPCNSYMQGYTKRRACCSVAAQLRQEPANDLSAQRNPVKPRSKLPLWSCPSYVSAQWTTQYVASPALQGNTIQREEMERSSFSVVPQRSPASKALHRTGPRILSALFYSLVMVAGKEESEHFKDK